MEKTSRYLPTCSLPELNRMRIPLARAVVNTGTTTLWT